MPIPPSFDDLYNIGRSEIQARNPRLTDWTEGSDLDAIAGGAAGQADEAIGILFQLFGNQFFDIAAGDDLDTLALDRFGTEIVRNVASAAIGLLRFTRGISSTPLLIPAGTTCQADVDGVTVTFSTDSAQTIPTGESFIDIQSTADDTGRDSNVAAGTVTTILDTLIGDAAATVTNQERFAGGSIAESDSSFRDRIKRFFNTLRRGTIAALETGALSVEGVSFVTIDESTVAPANGGYVSVYVGDPDGAGNTTLAALVDAELDNWRAAGVDVVVFASAREEIALALTVTIRKGTDKIALGESIRASVLGYTDNLASNETLFASKSEAQTINVDPINIKGAVQTSPATEETVPSAAFNALRVLESALSISFVEVT